MRREGAYNLACFTILFNEYQEENGIDFQELYLNFSKENDVAIKKVIAASIHEAFALTT
jgi:hypothetical protein